MRRHTIIIIFFACLAPAGIAGAYGESTYYGYGQGTYYGYGQSTYYAQGGYPVTITTPVTVTGAASIVGALSKGSGTFVIDHPLDPKNKLLYHSFVESPDVKNVYDGIANLDAEGAATIELPDYFLALNKDFRYQATAIGMPMPNLHLRKKVGRSGFLGMYGPIRFQIAGGEPNGRISWQVTGIRHDPFILANPIIPEVLKGDGTLVGKNVCLFEPLCK